MIRKALEKLPADRFASAAGFAGALREPSFRYGAAAVGEAVPATGWTRVTTGVAAAAVLALAGLGWSLTRPDPPDPVERYGFTTVTSEQFSLTPIELGPEGTGMVYYGQRETTGGFQLWYRRYDDLQATPIQGSVSGRDPMISPDGTEVAFDIAGQIWVVPLAGGVPRSIADSAVCCATWAPDGESVLFTGGGNQIRRVPSAGGPSEVVLESEAGRVPAWAFLLPDGNS
nr:hypothetical protein [Actinomycetota bacterium]